MRAAHQDHRQPEVQLNIQEIKQPELDAALIAQGVADQLAGRIAFRRAMKRRAERPEGRRPRHPGPVLGSPRRRRDEPHRVVPRRSRAAAHAARRHRLRLPRGPHHRRSHRREGVDLQGRHPALQEHQRGQDHREASPWPSEVRQVLVSHVVLCRRLGVVRQKAMSRNHCIDQRNRSPSWRSCSTKEKITRRAHGGSGSPLHFRGED